VLWCFHELHTIVLELDCHPDLSHTCTFEMSSLRKAKPHVSISLPQIPRHPNFDTRHLPPKHVQTRARGARQISVARHCSSRTPSSHNRTREQKKTSRLRHTISSSCLRLGPATRFVAALNTRSRLGACSQYGTRVHWLMEAADRSSTVFPGIGLHHRVRIDFHWRNGGSAICVSESQYTGLARARSCALHAADM
jgi:hypothetical protein